MNFYSIEKNVMSYIARNKKMCNFTELYNYIIDDNTIKDPKVLSDLKNKLYLVMSQLDSRYYDVNVIKVNNTYLVGYNIPNISNNNISNDTNLKEDLNKSTFEYIIDNDIDYDIKPDCCGETLLFQGIKMNDVKRVNKLLKKYPLSFFTKNKNDENVLDLIQQKSDLTFLKMCIQENNDEINILKKENETLKSILLKTEINFSVINNKILADEMYIKCSKLGLMSFFFIIYIYLIYIR